MVTLEQIKLLESKITRAIDVVTRLSEENLRLKKRNGELEDLAERLKNEKTRIEEGIVSALDRLNQFEDAIERSLDSVKGVKPQEQPAPQPPVPAEGRVSGESRPSGTPRKPAGPEQPAVPADQAGPAVPHAYLVDEEETENAEEDEDTGEAELDIF
jgi:FtsZ-binding cell division protein ZapB